jgi:hypothetical protein
VIGANQRVVISAIPGPLPRQLQRVDEDESCGRACANLVVRDRIRRKACDGGRACVERHGGRRIEFCRRRSSSREKAQDLESRDDRERLPAANDVKRGERLRRYETMCGPRGACVVSR